MPYKVIVDQEKDNHEVFSLSGIGAQFDDKDRDRLHVPQNENEIVQTAHDAGYTGDLTSSTSTIYPARYWSSENCHLYPHGYPFHSKCWTLVERRLGTRDSVRGHLEQLIIAIRKYWYTSNYDLSLYMPLRSYTRPWIPFVCFCDTEGHFNVVWPYQVDPVDNIPELPMLIRHSARERWSGRVKVRHIHNRKSCKQQLFFLPAELQFRVFGFLDSGIDVKSCASAFGWPIPNSLWREKLDGLIFELSEISCVVDIDWEYAYFETQQVLQRSRGLENRQRIWKALGSIRAFFFRALVKTNHTNLRDFVGDTYPPYSGPLDPENKWLDHAVVCRKPFPHTKYLKGDPPSDGLCECEKL
jgi:hypothetical protein